MEQSFYTRGIKMDYQYKVIVSNRSIYKEFEVDSDIERIKLGTTSNCELRLNADYFFDDIELEFEKRESDWEISCVDSTYISKGDMRKLLSTNVVHGDVFTIKYMSSGENVFELRFLIDFEAKIPFYNWKIDLKKIDSIRIGDDVSSDIVLKSDFSQGTQICLNRKGKQYELEEINTRFGMYLNGQRIKGTVCLNDFDFFSVADSSFYYKGGELYFDVSNLEIANIKVSILDAQTNSLRYPLFNRNTRVKEKVLEEKITILEPPALPAKPEQNLVMLLFPTLGMLALTIVVRGFMSSTSGSFILFSVCSMTMGMITSIWGFMNNGKKYKKAVKQRIEDYTRYISEKREEIINIRQRELDILNNTYHDLKKGAENVMDFSAELFDRRPEDFDYLEVFLGRGSIKAKQIIDHKKKECLDLSDELMNIPEQLAKEFECIKDAPITLNLKTANAVGIVGTEKSNYVFFKNILLDVAIRQFYDDVKIFTLIEPDSDKYNWMLLLPHLQGEEGKRNIVFDNESKTNIFEYLYKELSEREQMKKVVAPFLVILILDEYGIKSHPVSKFIAKAADLNAVFVFFENSIEKTPLNCGYIVDLKDDEYGEYYATADKNMRQYFNYKEISDELSAMLVRKMAPVYCEQISLESSLRKNISLFEILNIYNVQDLNLNKRWMDSKIYESIEVPLGVNAKNEIVNLNLHEKVHGPHGLVAGTTGSGKSEILQSYILSAATLYHPYEIGFVIIDFKGGGMVNQFRELPHLVGAITNIDGKEIDRSLRSIKAELLKRQTLFAEANVNHIDKYIRLYKEHKVMAPLPHLVIIVDEFAELKAEQPEFMKELISAARIGRSLGIHLILATQKPAGQVNEQIWSNSKFKLCLKVQTQEDSKEVLKSPLAAEIREPGRAYLQVGNNEIFELFQSAYSGGPAIISSDLDEKEYTIYEVGYRGRKGILCQKKKEKNKNAGLTELEAIVNYVAEHCEKNKIERLPNICLPCLPEKIHYRNDSIDKCNLLAMVPIGIYDDPDSQYQGRFYTDISKENTIIVGAAQMGKTNLLQLFIRSMVENNTPDDVNIYIMDFGSMILKNFEGLKHIGGIVLASEDEKVKNLFKYLLMEMDKRKEKLLRAGVSSFYAYREAEMKDMPKIYVMLDNYNVFKELYIDKYESAFIKLCRDGISLGISVVITSAMSNTLGFRHLSNFSNRICLTCNDKSEYNSLLERCKLEPDNIPGRLLAMKDKAVYEAQAYLAYEGVREFDRVNAIRHFVEDMNRKYNNYEMAHQIPCIPDILTRWQFEREFSDNSDIQTIPFGLDYATVDPIGIDLRDENEMVLVGKNKDNVITFLKSFLRTMKLRNTIETCYFHIIDNYKMGLMEYKNYPRTQNYTLDASESEFILDAVLTYLKRRKAQQLQGQREPMSERQVVVINSREAMDYIATTKPVMEKFNEIIKNYKDLGVLIIYSDIDNVGIPFTANELMKRIKENKKAYLFDDLSKVKIFDIPSTVLKEFSKKLGADEMYALNGTICAKVKLIREED